MKNLCIMGIDPGVSGAIAFYRTDLPHLVRADDAPVVNNRIDAASLADLIRLMTPDLAVIELVGAMPGQGVSSMFKFGQAYGTAIGVCASLAIPVEFVSPGKWKRYFGLNADKEMARERALRLWPANASQFKRKKDHGRAEAALLARYGAEVLTIAHSKNSTIADASDRGGAVEGALQGGALHSAA